MEMEELMELLIMIPEDKFEELLDDLIGLQNALILQSQAHASQETYKK